MDECLQREGNQALICMNLGHVQTIAELGGLPKFIHHQGTMKYHEGNPMENLAWGSVAALAVG
jgi:hypothetical protein